LNWSIEAGEYRVVVMIERFPLSHLELLVVRSTVIWWAFGLAIGCLWIELSKFKFSKKNLSRILKLE
jgi:hypothetical protein